ncbi:MAG: 3-deoxy-D-manno-octulosonic acid transferase [Proteobacteria bacterium]|nr:3-deoxy-D-manno-octulosonic acid transferase [Pseudomonadota bacterium]
MRVLYSLLLYLLLPFILLRLLLRSIKNPAYRRRVLERFGVYVDAPVSEGIWVHAVSVGEAIVAVKLIKALQLQYPDYAITVTCGTPTGSQIIQKQLGDGVFHVYAPYDLPGSVKRFLNNCQPAVGIIMETEIWPNLFSQASSSGVKVLISNMRLSEISFRRYQKFPAFISRVLSTVNQIAAQSDSDAQRAISLGADADRVQVVGNLKFDVDKRSESVVSSLAELKDKISAQRSVWLAGSTHEGEDEIILNVHEKLVQSRATLLLILVPRHPERFEKVYKLCHARFRTQKRSTLTDGAVLESDTQVLLVDSIGELDQFIGISDWAFIGGSLVPVGGHNILEACQAGVPVVFGEFMFNFNHIAKIVVEKEAGIQISEEADLVQAGLRLSEDPDARRRMGASGHALIEENQGATRRTLELLSGWLPVKE